MAYFDIEQSNLSNPAGLPSAPSQQEGVANIKGFEIEARTVIGEFKFDASYSYVDAKDPNDIIFPSVPKNQASAWAVWEPANGSLAGLRIGTGVRHASGNESHGTAFPAANNFEATPMVVTTGGYTVFDSLIGFDYRDMEFTLNFRNMFDSDYFGTCLARGDCFPGEGRTIVGRAKYKF